MYIQHPETATWIKQGAFDFAKKHAELLKDLPVQFGADGVARVVQYVQEPLVLQVDQGLLRPLGGRLPPPRLAEDAGLTAPGRSGRQSAIAART